MNKRKRFLITSLILSSGFVSFQFLENQYKFYTIGLLAIMTVVLFFFSLKEGLERNMTLLTLILPTFFTVGVGIFWFLLPVNFLTRLPVIVFYAVGIYVLCLTMNIFTVATIRTIALLRAARGVSFVLSLLTSFLIFDAFMSLKIPIFYLVPLVSFFSFPIFFQGFWTSSLNRDYERNVFNISFYSSLIVGEIAAMLYFWPVTVVVGSLCLTVVV
ncbi:MAG: hypothetical protein ABIJ05_03965, partial [Patescibacteria group bacterium]